MPTVATRIRTKLETLDEVRLALLAIVRQTHAEEGCIRFELHQSLDDPCRFRLSEVWSSRQALDAHLQQPYIRAFLGQSDELLAEPVDISLWQMIGLPTQPAR